MNYAQELKRAQDEESRGGPMYESLTDEQLRHGIEEITKRLKGPMPTSDRIVDCAFRKGMQAELSRRSDR